MCRCLSARDSSSRLPVFVCVRANEPVSFGTCVTRGCDTAVELRLGGVYQQRVYMKIDSLIIFARSSKRGAGWVCDKPSRITLCGILHLGVENVCVWSRKYWMKLDSDERRLVRPCSLSVFRSFLHVSSGSMCAS